jgi:hypothetical protein
VEGRPEGGYADMFEFFCCDGGDDLGLDARSDLSLSRSAAQTLVRPVLRRMSRTSACAAAGRGMQKAGLHAMPNAS